MMSRFEYVERTVDFAAGAWRDSVGREGPLPMPTSELARRGAGFRAKPPKPLQQVEELVKQFRAEGWGDMSVPAHHEPGRFKAVFRRVAA
jgi:hypothetical protein